MNSQKITVVDHALRAISVDVRIEARAVTYDIRRKAYRVLAKVAS